MDVHSKKQRSFNMSRIRGINTKPEKLIATFLKGLKIPFFQNYNKLPGKPDFYLPKHNYIIQVHGCFWHSHNSCKYFVLPKSNVNFWVNKLSKTKIRDRDLRKSYTKDGYSLLTIWECELRNEIGLEKILRIL